MNDELESLETMLQTSGTWRAEGETIWETLPDGTSRMIASCHIGIRNGDARDIEISARNQARARLMADAPVLWQRVWQTERDLERCRVELELWKRRANAQDAENARAAQANTFRAAFEEWIVNQTEDVKFSAAMAFGLEYIQLKG